MTVAERPIQADEFWPEDAEDDEAVVLEWFVSEGAVVDEDEPICEIQVEKANVDILAPVAGEIDEILVERDGEFDRDDTLAYLTPEDE